VENTKDYSFTKYFYQVYAERVGVPLNEDSRAYILSVLKTTEPHTKYDNKGRHSEYFTLRVEDKLITIVCDAYTHKIITCVIETHHRKEFENL
jgi:hypothetical protein